MKAHPLRNTAEMKTEGPPSFISRSERNQWTGRGRTMCPSGVEMRTSLVPHSTLKIQFPLGLNQQNPKSFQTAPNGPERDKSNWSPCHRSLSLTASCHSNKLDCCRMRPINCDVRRPCQVPCARCNCEHQWFLGFAGALYQNAILHSASFMICKCLSDRMGKRFLAFISSPFSLLWEREHTSVQLCISLKLNSSEKYTHSTSTLKTSHSRWIRVKIKAGPDSLKDEHHLKNMNSKEL